MDGNVTKLVKATALVLIIGIFVYGAYLIKGMVGDNEFQTTMNSAIKGDVDSQLRLAIFYDQGRYTKTSRKTAQEWFEIAARNGSEVAKDMLCINYRIGCDQ